jgi:hypothetical protein
MSPIWSYIGVSDILDLNQSNATVMKIEQEDAVTYLVRMGPRAKPPVAFVIPVRRRRDYPFSPLLH